MRKLESKVYGLDGVSSTKTTTFPSAKHRPAIGAYLPDIIPFSRDLITNQILIAKMTSLVIKLEENKKFGDSTIQ